MELVREAAQKVGARFACSALGVARASFYRSSAPATVEPKREVAGGACRVPGRALTSEERDQVVEVLDSERFQDQAVPQVYATLLDEGRYLCSMSSMYRILRSLKEVVERRRLREHTPAARPELLAKGPNEVWSWDITKLRGPRKWSYFYLYVILDVFSRYVVGWMVAERESAELARVLIEETVLREGVAQDQLTIHSDRGAPMTSKSVAELLVDLGVEKSHSRPHTSNDNPFSESHFKTVKYRPEVPERFASAEHAREVFRELLGWYNDCHHHSGIGLLTPATLHHGQADEVTRRREEALLLAHAAHPERFVRGVPRAPIVPEEVWINRPITEQPS